MYKIFIFGFTFGNIIHLILDMSTHHRSQIGDDVITSLKHGYALLGAPPELLQEHQAGFHDHTVEVEETPLDNSTLIQSI